MRFAKEAGPPSCWSPRNQRRRTIAGPKTLEHIVDTVLYFEAKTTLDHRILPRREEPLRLGR